MITQEQHDPWSWGALVDCWAGGRRSRGWGILLELGTLSPNGRAGPPLGTPLEALLGANCSKIDLQWM